MKDWNDSRKRVKTSKCNSSMGIIREPYSSYTHEDLLWRWGSDRKWQRWWGGARMSTRSPSPGSSITYIAHSVSTATRDPIANNCVNGTCSHEATHEEVNEKIDNWNFVDDLWIRWGKIGWEAGLWLQCWLIVWNWIFFKGVIVISEWDWGLVLSFNLEYLNYSGLRRLGREMWEWSFWRLK